MAIGVFGRYVMRIGSKPNPKRLVARVVQRISRLLGAIKQTESRRKLQRVVAFLNGHQQPGLLIRTIQTRMTQRSVNPRLDSSEQLSLEKDQTPQRIFDSLFFCMSLRAALNFL